MRLPRIFDHFRQGQIFTIEEARENLKTTGNTLRKRLSELAAKGYITPIRQGYYRLAKLGAKEEKSHPFAVASKLTPYCYVGFHSAMQFHAGETPTPDQTVFVVSPTKFNSFKFEGIHYFWCQSPEPYGLETKLIPSDDLDFPVLTTTFEKSLIDCLKRPAHCPPFDVLVELCVKYNKEPNLEKILQYATDCNVQVIFNRLGFLLEHLPSWKICEDLFQSMQVKMSRKKTEWSIGCTQNKEQDCFHLPSILLKDEAKNRWKVHFDELLPVSSSHTPKTIQKNFNISSLQTIRERSLM